jgi:hypothetical protein
MAYAKVGRSNLTSIDEGLTWTARDDGRRSNVFTAFTRQTSASQAYNNAPRNAAPSPKRPRPAGKLAGQKSPQTPMMPLRLHRSESQASMASNASTVSHTTFLHRLLSQGPVTKVPGAQPSGVAFPLN